MPPCSACSYVVLFWGMLHLIYFTSSLNILVLTISSINDSKVKTTVYFFLTDMKILGVDCLHTVMILVEHNAHNYKTHKILFELFSWYEHCIHTVGYKELYPPSSSTFHAQAGRNVFACRGISMSTVFSHPAWAYQLTLFPFPTYQK